MLNAETARGRLWANVEKTENCWLWVGGTYPDGYGFTSLGGKSRRVHRVFYELCVGPIPPGLMVLHRCDVPNCVNPAHLFLGTAGDNARDMVAKGRFPARRGELNYSSKLTWNQVREIRRLYALGKYTHRSLGELFGVKHSAIGSILKGEHWRESALQAKEVGDGRE